MKSSFFLKWFSTRFWKVTVPNHESRDPQIIHTYYSTKLANAVADVDKALIFRYSSFFCFDIFFQFVWKTFVAYPGNSNRLKVRLTSRMVIFRGWKAEFYWLFWLVFCSGILWTHVSSLLINHRKSPSFRCWKGPHKQLCDIFIYLWFWVNSVQLKCHI